MTQRGIPAASLITPSLRSRRRRTTRPAASSPTTLQLFLPRSIPNTAICISPLLILQLPWQLCQPSPAEKRGGPFHKTLEAVARRQQKNQASALGESFMRDRHSV